MKTIINIIYNLKSKEKNNKSTKNNNTSLNKASFIKV